MSNTIDPNGSWSVNFWLFKEQVPNYKFSMPYIFFISEVFLLKLTNIVNVTNVKNILKQFLKCHFRWWDMMLRNSKIAFHFLRNGERYSHGIFMDDRSLNCGVREGDEHASRHFRSSPEVKKRDTEILKLLSFQFESYTTLLNLFSIVQNCWPDGKLRYQLPIILKSFKFSIFKALNLLWY